MSREIVVFSNDVVPGMGLPVAAPGLRASGIANGLRRNGHRVTLAVDARVVQRAHSRRVPPPRPRDAILLTPAQVGDLVRTRRPRAVVLTNSNHFSSIEATPGTSLIYDFFAPKMLELAQEDIPNLEDALAALRRRKLEALGRCDAVVLNGEKKASYLLDWLARAGRTPGSVPVVQVPTPLDVSAPTPPPAGPLHAIVAGYLQPWSTPGSWAREIEPMLAGGDVKLHIMMAHHWGGQRERDGMPPAFRELLEAPGVVRHGVSEYADFRRLLSSCHLSIDVFQPNPERELAMVTRTLVALSCGVPVVHVPFTESGALVDRYGAGWLVAGDDPEGVFHAIEESRARPAVLAERRQGAITLARELLDPEAAVRPLSLLLDAL